MTARFAFRLSLLCLLAAFVAAVCSIRADAADNAAEAKTQITRVLEDQARAWNTGDIDKFMDGYARRDDLRFASGANITYGWQPTLERYKQRYPDRAAMGALTFSDLAIDVLGADAAVVFGRWKLQLTGGGEPHGLFTLIFRKTDAGWRIVADHTSAAAAD